jgi:hypothetical protein
MSGKTDKDVAVSEKRPPMRAGDNSHKSETRISAIANFARRRKR